MLNVHLYMAQRITALLMAPMVLVHLGVMIYAIQGGLSAAEILGRTQGSLFWLLFYGSFVLAVSIHAAIGLRVVVHEIFGLKGKVLFLFTLAMMGLLLGLGSLAVAGVVML